MLAVYLVCVLYCHGGRILVVSVVSWDVVGLSHLHFSLTKVLSTASS